MSITGTELPTKVGVPIADLLAGMNGAYGVVAALHERTRTGVGRVVRTSLLAGMVGVHAFQGTRWTVAGRGAGAGRRPPPVDRAVRHVRDRLRADPDRLRFGGAVACVRRRVRARPGRATVRHQPRAGGPPRRAGRGDGAALRGPAGRALAGAAVPGGRTGGQGAHPRRRLRLGADQVPGPADRRRAPDARARCSCPGHPSGSTKTRTAAAAPSTSRRPTLGQHDAEIRQWLAEDR